MKKLCIIVGIFAFIALLTGIPYIIDGIRDSGFDGVNYGRVLVPALLCSLSLWLYKKR